VSTAAVIACDGCGNTATSINVGKRPGVYPAGWLRLSVTGRPAGETSAVQLTKVDVCAPVCAVLALQTAGERVKAG